MTDALSQFETIGTKSVRPNPGLMKAIGLNHSLESAVADLVDNSIDAKASRVLLRFVLHKGLVRHVLLLDDGAGMDNVAIDNAMELGRPKDAHVAPLGFFGMGLKSASFSQADVLTVLSKSVDGEAQGRRLSRESVTANFDVELLSSDAAQVALSNTWRSWPATSGTLIRWDGLRGFPSSVDPDVTNRFLDRKINSLKQHLGLIFHRLIARGSITIAMDVFDHDAGDAGFAFAVEPVDPFGYGRSGAVGYPKAMLAPYAGQQVKMHCHIWPGNSDTHQFKLGSPVDRYQGFYLYRNDRLLSSGGWDGVWEESKLHKLARVVIDIEHVPEAFQISVEKAGVRMTSEMVRAVGNATAPDGTTFSQYLEDAKQVFQESNRRVRRRQAVLPPGQGIAPLVKRAIETHEEILPGEDPVRIRWRRFVDDEFVEVDRNARTLWLNDEYRSAVLKGSQGGVNDAPLLKTLLYLLFEDIFRGAAYGPNDKENVQIWSEILSAAAQEEWDDYTA